MAAKVQKIESNVPNKIVTGLDWTLSNETKAALAEIDKHIVVDPGVYQNWSKK